MLVVVCGLCFGFRRVSVLHQLALSRLCLRSHSSLVTFSISMRHLIRRWLPLVFLVVFPATQDEMCGLK